MSQDDLNKKEDGEVDTPTIDTLHLVTSLEERDLPKTKEHPSNEVPKRLDNIINRQVSRVRIIDTSSDSDEYVY